jgi:hypothetical protein
MKIPLLCAASLLLGTCLSASAAVTISDSSLPVNLSTMPGSDTDFTLFGDSGQFPTVNSYGGAEGQPTVLNDFTVAPGAGASDIFGGNVNYSTINGPTGSGDAGVLTGIVFHYTSTPDLVDFTLGKAGSTFNFSNFNVYVMYGNAHDGYEIDTSLTLTLLPPASSSDQTPLKSVTLPSTDGNTNLSEATFQEFTISGASAGDVLQIGAGGFGYLGGVSFAEAPEPPAYLLLGLGMLGLFLARRTLTRC